MKNLKLVVVSLLILPAAVAPAPLAYGEEKTPGLEVVKRLSPPEVSRHLAELSAFLDAKRGELRPNAVLDDRWSWIFAIPLAGNTPGSRGTYFRSDVTFSNQNFERSQFFRVFFFPQGMDNTAAQGFLLDLRGGEIFTARDFIGDFLGITGIGTLLVHGVDENGNIDQLAALDGYSRVWTPQRDDPTATASAQFNAVDVNLLANLPGAVAIGLRNDPEFRTNVGIVNLSSRSETWDVTVIGEGGAFTLLEITVPPQSVKHVGVGDIDLGNTFVEFQVRGDPTGLQWLAYGTTNDNISGDGWVSLATPQREAPGGTRGDRPY
ncbi:MAG: hypothetical protein KY459_03335 [Acidobacteria bacterium]|nr:hypothetical protein [Acidobacteriota bacterium]